MKPLLSDIQQDVSRALAEDVGSGDITAALLPPDLMVSAEIIAREPLFVCGQAWVDAVFKTIDATMQIQWLVPEGSWQAQPVTLCQLHGNARHLLTAERSALNFLQTLSGTATQTYHMVQQLTGSHARLLDTRKTIPGLRLAQKYAVACAGGHNHRFGLYDAFLIKENHIAACGSITKAIMQARQLKPAVLLEVEVETIQELQEALAAKPDRILLDNFTLPMIRQAQALREKLPCELEVSGGIDMSNIAEIAKTGVDYISVGAITKSVRAIDLSLLVRGIE